MTLGRYAALAMLVLASAACDISVAPSEWKQAEEVCKNNGGLKRYYADPIELFGEAVCNNGAVFDDPLPEEK